jgi:hypothetical protein
LRRAAHQPGEPERRPGATLAARVQHMLGHVSNGLRGARTVRRIGTP